MRKVLVVDDDPIQLRIRGAVLRGAGLDVCTASQASAALAILQEDAEVRSIGVVITDHIMPEAPGTDFVRKLRGIRPGIAVIVISGLPEAESQYEGLNVAFRQKPCPPPELISLVKSFLDMDNAA
jgi:DNA-binding NtrC family response regulator